MVMNNMAIFKIKKLGGKMIYEQIDRLLPYGIIRINGCISLLNQELF